MISSKSEYRNVSVQNIPVTGNIYPVRDRDRKGPRTLVAEDLSFLAQAVHDRARIAKKWHSGGHRWVSADPGNPSSSSSSQSSGGDRTVDMNPDLSGVPAFGLPLSPGHRKVFAELSKFFSNALFGNGWHYSDREEFVKFVDPTSTYVVRDKMLDDEFAASVASRNWRDVELGMLSEMRCDAAAFANRARCSPDADYVSAEGPPPLSQRELRDAYADLWLLRRVIVPCDTTGSSYCDWQESGYDQDPGTGASYSASLVVKPLCRNPTFDFSTVSCFCTVPNEGDTTPTLYMSEKSVYYGENSSPCCADWVNVRPTVDDDIDLVPFGGDLVDKSRLQPTRVYLLVRAWRWNLDGMPYDTLESKVYLTSFGTSSWKITAERVSEEKCRKYLETCGFPSECDRQYDGETSVRHIAKVGVDLVGIYVDARLKDPPVKTDTYDLGWSP